MDKKNLQMLIWAVVVVVVVIALYFILGNKQVESPTITNDESEPVQDNTPPPQNSGATVSPINISYTDALIKYADRRIQLDPNCQAHPNTVTYKDNTGIMIDNRSDKTRTVKTGITFTIKPWGFKIVVLPDVYLKASTVLVDCDGYQNVATVLIQE